MPVATVSTLTSKMMSVGSKPLVHEDVVRARTDGDLALDRVGCPCSSKAMTITAAP
jgi:hypothetical protein